MKIFNKNRKKKITESVVNNEDFVRYELIYNAKDNFMILLSFSKSKFNDVIELLSDCNKSNLKTLYRHSSYNEKTNKKDDKGYSIYNVYERHYILISGNDDDYNSLFFYSDNIGNSLLKTIIKAIQKNRDNKKYKKLIDDNIISNNFANNSVKYDNLLSISNIEYDNIDIIKSRLPCCFIIQNILRFIKCYINDYKTSLYSLLLSDNDEYKILFKDIIEIIFPNTSFEKALEILSYPQYMIPDDDTLAGDVLDSNLDEIFKRQYEKFTGSIDENIKYQDIDEIIENEENSNGDKN